MEKNRSRAKTCLLGGLAALFCFGLGRLLWFAAWDIPWRVSGCSGVLITEPKSCLSQEEDWDDPLIRAAAEKRSRTHGRWMLIMMPVLLIAGILLIPTWLLSPFVPSTFPDFAWHILATVCYLFLGAGVAHIRTRRARGTPPGTNVG